MQLPIKLVFFALIAIAVVFEVIADILFKEWALGSPGLFVIIGLLIYSVGTIFWAVSLKYGYLSNAISFFTVLNLILVGTLYFKESLSTINKIGIILGIISIILIEL